jgi:hypothetical protein
MVIVIPILISTAVISLLRRLRRRGRRRRRRRPGVWLWRHLRWRRIGRWSTSLIPAWKTLARWTAALDRSSSPLVGARLRPHSFLLQAKRRQVMTQDVILFSRTRT